MSAQIPTNDHYGIITHRSIHHEGDQRSRDAPGHGYPAYTETVLNYEVFSNRTQWENRIHQLQERREKFLAGLFTAARVETIVNIGIELPKDKQKDNGFGDSDYYEHGI